MKTLTIDINGTCNLACEYCYQDLEGSMLSRDDVLSIVEARPDFGRVEIGGGEPFLHPELTDIVSDIIALDRKVHLSTNAVCVPKSFPDLDSGIRENIAVQVSLPASDRESYQDITGSDSFDTVLDNTGALKRHFRTSLNTVVYQRNLDQVSGILKIGYDLGIPLRINPVLPVGKGKEVALLDHGQIDRLRGLLLAEKIRYPEMIESPLVHEINCPVLAKTYGFQKTGSCPALCGRKEYYDPRGNAKSCEFYPITKR